MDTNNTDSICLRLQLHTPACALNLITVEKKEVVYVVQEPILRFLSASFAVKSTLKFSPGRCEQNYEINPIRFAQEMPWKINV